MCSCGAAIGLQLGRARAAAAHFPFWFSEVGCSSPCSSKVLSGLSTRDGLACQAAYKFALRVQLVRLKVKIVQLKCGKVLGVYGDLALSALEPFNAVIPEKYSLNQIQNSL